MILVTGTSTAFAWPPKSLLRAGGQYWRLAWYFFRPGHFLELHVSVTLFFGRQVMSDLSRSWNFPGKNIGVDCHFLLQGISLSQGLNQSLLLGRWILYYSATREAKSDTLINRKKIGRDSKILYMVSSCFCWRKEVYSCSCSVSDLERFLSRPTVIVLELAQFIVFSVFFI